MKTVWKYHIFQGESILAMPSGAEVVSFGLDPHGSLCVWAMVEDTHVLVPHHVLCVGTGWPIDMPPDEPYWYVGMALDGPYIWHLFDLGESEVVQAPQGSL